MLVDLTCSAVTVVMVPPKTDAAANTNTNTNTTTTTKRALRVAFEDIPDVVFRAHLDVDATAVAAWRSHEHDSGGETLVRAPKLALPDSLVTAFRVTHRGTAFNLTEDQATRRAACAGIKVATVVDPDRVFARSSARVVLAGFVVATRLRLRSRDKWAALVQRLKLERLQDVEFVVRAEAELLPDRGPAPCERGHDVEKEATARLCEELARALHRERVLQADVARLSRALASVLPSPTTTPE